jgi:hypothetical protein
MHALVLGDPKGFHHELAQLLGTVGGEPVPGIEMLAQSQLGLVRERGDRPGALMGINYQQMDGV